MPYVACRVITRSGSLLSQMQGYGVWIWTAATVSSQFSASQLSGHSPSAFSKNHNLASPTRRGRPHATGARP